MAAKQISIIEDPALIGPISIIEDPADNIVRPMMTHIASASCGIDIKSNGNATVDSYVLGYPYVTNVSITAYLQQYKNGSWVTIAIYTATDNSYYVSLNEITTVEKGYKYRTRALVRAYDGSTIEAREIYSPEATY